MSSQHTIAPPRSGISPKIWYQSLARQPGFIADEAQAVAIERLEVLWQALVEFKRKRNRWFGRSLLPQPILPRGLWLWGGVGRGKSFLMDAFFAGLPYRRKQRLHFHHFMQQVHSDLRGQVGHDDPLARVAERWAKAVRVLCFDEFHVSDIADAMILGRLVEQLFARGVVLVATSNYAPDHLYPNGLQRENFLPTIALLKSKLDVLTVDGGQDYRLRTLTAARTFLVPLAVDHVPELTQLFDAIATGNDLSKTLLIEGRKVPAVRHAPGIVWFDFSVLCGDGRGQADYLELARRYHTVIVTGIAKMTVAQSNLARRFTWLVDVFYDHRVKLILTADASAEQLYTVGPQAQEFFRTVSRLIEMQSKQYLALPHQSIDELMAGVTET